MDILGISILFNIMLYLALPILVIVLIVRLVGRRHVAAKPHETSVHDLITGTVMLAGGFAGVLSLYNLPSTFFGGDKISAFATHLISGILLLIIGLLIKHLTGTFLMVMGCIMIALALPFVFQNFGSVGVLLIVLVAFCLLVGITVMLTRKDKAHG